MASNAVKNLGERLNRSNTDYTFQFSNKETLLIIIEHNYKLKATQLAAWSNILMVTVVYLISIK